MNRQSDRQPTIAAVVSQLLGTAGADFSVRDVTGRTGTSRQAVHRQLAALVRSGRLIATGKGRATRYQAGGAVAAGAGRGPRDGDRALAFDRSYPTSGLAEDEVWTDVVATLPALASPAGRNARDVMAYALTEMVNNAIDHSASPSVVVKAGQEARRVWFQVEDQGVGAFENVRAARGLPDALAGLQEISKGKQTTLPDRHSGEGIFFTSKMADQFELMANGLSWLVDNLRQDQAIGTAPAHPGTTVRFEIASDKTERPEAVFARYTHDLEFDTTRTVVKLFSYGVRFVSRSEAKRLLGGLDRFRHVILDFSGVEAVGQGFVDEVFRVWAQAHPIVALQAEHMAPPVAFMVGRAQASAGGQPRG